MQKSHTKDIEILGGASYVALGRYIEAADAVAAKLNAEFEGVADRPEPTAQELIALRDRYLERKALTERQDSLRGLLEENYLAEIAGTVVKVIYRLTLFAAAAMILYRGLMPHISG